MEVMLVYCILCNMHMVNTEVPMRKMLDSTVADITKRRKSRKDTVGLYRMRADGGPRAAQRRAGERVQISRKRI